MLKTRIIYRAKICWSLKINLKKSTLQAWIFLEKMVFFPWKNPKNLGPKKIYFEKSRFKNNVAGLDIF